MKTCKEEQASTISVRSMPEMSHATEPLEALPKGASIGVGCPEALKRKRSLGSCCRLPKLGHLVGMRKRRRWSSR